MPENKPESQPGSLFGSEVETNLKAAFNQLLNKVHILLFTEQGQNDVLNQAVLGLLRAFDKLSNKIELSEFNLNGPEAKKYNVTSSPTLIFEPDRYSIRYLGVPFGEEGRTLVGMILLLGFGEGNLGEQSRKILSKIDSKREIKVFVSPTCPYCPDQAINTVKAAIERPDLVSLEIIDIQSNQEIANRYSAFSVPQTFANDILIAHGAQSEELFMVSLQKLEQQTVFIPEMEEDLIETDVVIVGGGPAGLTAGIYTVRSGLRTSVIERGPLGGRSRPHRSSRTTRVSPACPEKRWSISWSATLWSMCRYSRVRKSSASNRDRWPRSRPTGESFWRKRSYLPRGPITKSSTSPARCSSWAGA